MKKIDGGVTAAQGFQSAGITCGLKESGQKDLALIHSRKPALAAAVFTTNQAQAAPVILSRERLQKGRCQAIIINSGNANACTGEQGLAAAGEMTQLTADDLGLKPELVAAASTGIIGQTLPMDKIRAGIHKAVTALTDDDRDAARAILTTDDHVKTSAYQFTTNTGREVTVGGMAKGSGMIHPGMATMLAFITTDISIERKLLKEALREANAVSFNCISVDGDQSTNDSLFVLANGEAGNQKIASQGGDYGKFLEALKKVSIDLAQAIVDDGEGATKFITIKVKGAPGDKEAEKIARQVANSNLVKTACFGSDPNWGRILAAAGAAGVEFALDEITVSINNKELFKKGLPQAADRKELAGLMDEHEILIEITLQSGAGTCEFWTTDLSYKYVEINAEYHT